MKKSLATFLLTGIMLTGCHKVIETQISSPQNVASTEKLAVEKEFEDLTVQANQGDAEAQYSLAVMYDDGEGVDEDSSKAIEWLKKSANQGYAKAQYELAWAYYNYDGTGTREDYDRHLEWRAKAINQGIGPRKFINGVPHRKSERVRQIMPKSLRSGRN